MPFTLEYEGTNENCEISADALLAKTKSPEILVLKFDNINYLLTNNLKYLETEKLNLMILLDINPITSNFSYEIESKSNFGSTYEFTLKLLFKESFTNSPTLSLSFSTIIF